MPKIKYLLVCLYCSGRSFSFWESFFLSLGQPRRRRSARVAGKWRQFERASPRMWIVLICGVDLLGFACTCQLASLGGDGLFLAAMKAHLCLSRLHFLCKCTCFFWNPEWTHLGAHRGNGASLREMEIMTMVTEMKQMERPTMPQRYEFEILKPICAAEPNVFRLDKLVDNSPKTLE